MTDKVVYLYDKETHRFKGAEFAYESASKPGEYIIPANATLIEPPAQKSDYDLFFENNKWKEVKIETDTTPESEKKIRDLKIKLAETDYKVLKNMEASLTGQPLPYDPQKLHNQRQSWRNQMKSLEKKNGK